MTKPRLRSALSSTFDLGCLGAISGIVFGPCAPYILGGDGRAMLLGAGVGAMIGAVLLGIFGLCYDLSLTRRGRSTALCQQHSFVASSLRGGDQTSYIQCHACIRCNER